jgi:hypothetical protein
VFEDWWELGCGETTQGIYEREVGHRSLREVDASRAQQQPASGGGPAGHLGG